MSGLKQGWRCNAGREGTPVLTVVQEGSSGEEPGRPGSLIDEIVREGARRMLAEALRAEVDAYVAAFAGERDENGRRLVVRNGYREPREVLTSAGAVRVTAPRVNDRRTDPVTGERKRPEWPGRVQREVQRPCCIAPTSAERSKPLVVPMTPTRTRVLLHDWLPILPGAMVHTGQSSIKCGHLT
jgi:hypothetical protein